MSKLKKVLQNIFSVKNTADKKYKVMKFVGIKFRINRKKLPFSKKYLITEINHLQKEINHLKLFKNEELIRRNYAYIKKKLQSECKNRKINILFLCNTNSYAKFSYTSLYEELEKNSKFNIKLAVSYTTVFTHSEYEKNNYKNNILKSYNFFKGKGYNVDFAYDLKEEKFIDLTLFHPDIIFYTEPWEVAKEHDLLNTSKFALSCFCCYGTTIHNGSYEYTKPFYRNLFKYFIDNYQAKELMIKHDVAPESLKVFGSIKLDAYLRPINYTNQHWKHENKKRVIYAPHHSFSPITYLKYGTFDKNYNFFLNYAKSHQDIEFILKPHPTLKKEILRHRLMDEKGMIQYFKEWEMLPNAQICEGGDYYDMFRTSDLMITDCNSFLSEYLPTEKPLIHLISEYSVGHNEYGQKIIAGYYPSYSNKETEQLLNDILYKNLDPLFEKRKEIIEKDLVWEKNGTATEIVKYLENIIFNEG